MNKLKKITTAAKTLYKTGKYKKWTDAIKAASKKIGAIKIVEKGENKNAKPKAVYQSIRSKTGTYKGMRKIGASGSHKDTRSHNVNIRVLSGIGSIELTRITNDKNGNPRYVVHFLQLLNDEEKSFMNFSQWYAAALKKARKIGGRKFHNKQYGGGIVFQSFSVDELKKLIHQVKHS